MSRPEVVPPNSYLAKRTEIRVLEAQGVGIVGHQNMRECLLDCLLRDGLLGPQEPAQRRYGAGMWLRTLHGMTGATPSQTGSYAPAQDTGHDEMTDDQAEAFRTYSAHLRRLARESNAVTADLIIRVCCWDQPPGCVTTLAFLRSGLDRLARIRGL